LWYFVLNSPNFSFLWFALLLIDGKVSLYTSDHSEGRHHQFEKNFVNCAGQETIQPSYCKDVFPDLRKWKLDGPTFCYVTSKYENDYHKAIYKCLTSTTWFEAQQQNYYIMIRFKWHSEPILGFQGGFPFIFMGFPFYCLAIIENSAGNCESHKFVQKINPRNLYWLVFLQFILKSIIQIHITSCNNYVLLTYSQ